MSKRNRQFENDSVPSSPATKRSKNDDEPSSEYSHDDYTVGWICALSKEQTAAIAMLDHQHADLPKPPKDPNTYTLGAIGEHNIVIACLPKGKYGNISAATMATHMISTFPSIKLGLMVGIGGGIPPKIRLGDVVVSTPEGSYPGVVQWDMGKALERGSFQRTGALNNPPTLLLTAVSKLESAHEMNRSRMPMYLDEMKQRYPSLAAKYLRTDSLKDVLFKAGYSHVSKVISDGGAALDEADSGEEEEEEEEEEEGCRFCDKGQIVKRKPRDMRIHHGLIASGNQVIKDAALRVKLNKELGGRVLCVEMEAAGLMDDFPCLVIRGICDYADSHKNKDWQEHAAAVAAAYAKDLLQYVQPSDVDGERPVKDMLKQVCGTLSSTAAGVAQLNVKVNSKEEREILDWLTPIDHGPRQSDNLKRRQPGTGQWLLDSEKFQRWLSTGSQTLFCPGIPGGGKTILTSIVVDYLHSRFHDSPKTGIAYIYCNYQRQDEQKIDNLLASILKQLAESQPLLSQSIRDLFDRHNKKRTRPSCDEILSSLQSVVATYSRVFIVVDALDECQAADGCRTRFLSELLKLQTKGGVNIFATSRHSLEISDHFKDNGSTLEIRASTNDIARYLEGHMSHLPSFVQQDQQLQGEITKGISEAVDGMFLLAQIYLDLLQDKMTLNNIRDAMKVFMRQGQNSSEKEKVEALNIAYEQALERINAQMPGLKKLAMDVLSWVTCPKRPLTTLELQHALATKRGKHELDRGDLPHVQDMVSACAGLVTIDSESNIIRLVHYTTQEYLIETRTRWFPGADSAITTTCVTYLSFSVFDTGFCETHQEFEQRLLSNPLYDYAARHWGFHAPHDTGPDQAVIRFLKNQAKVEASSQALMVDKQYSWYNYSQMVPKDMTGLHLVGYFGLSEAVDILLRSGQRPTAKDTDNKTPLWYAAQEGHKAVVDELLAAGAEVDVVNNRGDTVLQIAARRGHLEVVERLLAADAGVNARDNSGWRPLQLAATGGHLKVIERLLAAGAEVNAADNNGKTALQMAARGGHLEIVERLLVAGADVNAVNNDSETVLLIAAKEGHLEIVERLLAAGAGVNAVDRYSETALQMVVKRGYLEIVKRLLVAGAEVNAVDNNGETVLQIATREGYLKTVKRLLAAGADVNAVDKYSKTALQMAARGGHLEIVERLLVAGADVNAADNNGKTALQMAARGGHLEIVERLLVAGADVNAADNNGKTALQMAARGGHLEIVERLLVAGADVNAADNNGKTAVLMAARGGRLKVIKKLLVAGAEVNAVDVYGETALLMLARRGHLKVVKKLQAADS